jgi:Asp-tRNA(Asn)/Glu-tRNA(Gln) amidotransferase A subunit family amidase
MSANAAPVADHENCAWLSATEQIEAFRRGTLSPVDVLTAQIGRIEAHGDRLNAITYTHFESALAAARESERRYREGNAHRLEGVTVAVKDEFARDGWNVTQGSRVFKNDRQKEDHPVVAKLLQAGAILHVQSTAPELYLLGVTWSDLWGVTRNPWNSDITPGGSSGGSAALVAAGMATLAIGSDMGGSIRIPCTLTGLYGSKPAYGRIPSPDPSALVPHASPGPLARSLPDLMLLQNVMMGSAPGCPSTLRPKLDLEMPRERPKRRLALSLNQGWAALDADVIAAVRQAAGALERAGHTVEEIALDLGTDGHSLRATIEKALFSTALGAELIELGSKRHELTSYARRFVDLAGSLGPLDANEAAEKTLQFYKAIEEAVFAKGFDALISPTVATTRIPAAFDPTKDTVRIGDRLVDPYSGWFLTSVFSLLNWMPVINVPASLTANGVPCGLQIATRPYEDAIAYEIAAGYAEQAEPLPFADNDPMS